MSEKKRLDCLLFDMGLAESREKAKTLIMMGQVYVDNQKSDKPGTPVSEDAKIEVRGGGLPYVSRGGLKLEKAMHTFDISLKDKICMDIGASTGGFTDCMLQNGAKKVYSIDVGYGQLAWKLRTNPNVVNLERTNIRYITREQVPDNIDFASVDVSFISLTLVLPVAYQFLSEQGEMVCLIKPQFEAGRDKIGKNGVVRDTKTHIEVLTNAIEHVRSNGFSVHGIEFSPITGPKGNIEFLLYLGHEENAAECGMGETELAEAVEKTVSDAHTTLK